MCEINANSATALSQDFKASVAVAGPPLPIDEIGCDELTAANIVTYNPRNRCTKTVNLSACSLVQTRQYRCGIVEYGSLIS
jgi:hypothetical protein